MGREEQSGNQTLQSEKEKEEKDCTHTHTQDSRGLRAGVGGLPGEAQGTLPWRCATGILGADTVWAGAWRWHPVPPNRRCWQAASHLPILSTEPLLGATLPRM